MGTDIALSTMGATSDVSSAWNWLDGVYQAIAGAQAANLGGQLTPAQVAAIKAQTDAQITQAAGGNADLAASEIAAANSEIDSVIAQSGTTPGDPLVRLGGAAGGRRGAGLRPGAVETPRWGVS